jgi:hypothetical protein
MAASEAGEPESTMRFPLPLRALLALGVLAGCGSPEPARPAPDSTARSSPAAPGASPYEMPQMKEAKVHRDIGYRELTAAYAAKPPEVKDAHFGRALDELEKAQALYHEALPAAPDRYKPIIDKEADTVAATMRQIQRDRASPKVD